MTERTQRTIQNYGWKPSPPDRRDLFYSASPAVSQVLPETFNLVVDHPTPMPSCYDQGQLGSCVPNEGAYLVQWERRKEGLSDFIPSRLLLYYEARKLEGDIGADNGCYIRDLFQVLSTIGAPPETDWPYDISKYSDQPPPQAYTDAALDRVVQYMQVPQTPTQIKSSIFEGLPVMLGIAVFDQFESPEAALSGEITMPPPDANPIGFHCVRCVGWDNPSGVYVCGNSWGTAWGMSPAKTDEKGYFTLPQAYVHDTGLASDLWSIRLLG